MEGLADLRADPRLVDEARRGREGFRPALRADAREAVAPRLPPSATPISDDAYRMIVALEVTSASVYEQRYQRPTWPGGASGATIGIGYDLGYVSQQELEEDWQDALPPSAIQRLGTAVGRVGGSESANAAMRQLVASLQDVVVPWTAAEPVFRERLLPRYVALTERSLPNTRLLSADSLGALVSLVYNRGASFDRRGDRYAEMRAIKRHMRDRAFALIPQDLRSMARLWPDLRGLRVRRELEARLFEQGLRAGEPQALG